MKKIIDNRFLIIKICAVLVGAGELFLANIPIEAFTNLDSEIYGFFYFIFILSGLVMIFNALYVNKNFKALISSLIASTISIWSGLIVVNRILTTNTESFSDIALGFLLILIGLVIYGIILLLAILSVLIKIKQNDGKKKK